MQLCSVALKTRLMNLCPMGEQQNITLECENGIFSLSADIKQKHEFYAVPAFSKFNPSHVFCSISYSFSVKLFGCIRVYTEFLLDPFSCN